MFLKISETMCLSLSLIYPEGLQVSLKDTPMQVFSCEIYDIFKNAYFEKHLRTTASEL